MGAADGIRAGKAFVELGVKDRLSAGLKSAQRRLKSFGRSVGGLGRGLAMASAAIVGPIAGAIKVFTSLGDAVDKTSKRTGASAEFISEVGFAAEQSGGSIESVEKALFGLSRATYDAANGSKEAVDALTEVGLTAEQLEGLSPEEQFLLVAEGLSNMTDESKRGAVAQKLFGRAGRQLLPMFANGAAGIEGMREQARALGLSLSGESAAGAAAMADAQNELFRTVKAVAFVIGEALLPAALKIAQTATRVVVSIIGWVKQNQQLILTVAAVAAGVGAAGVALMVLGGVAVGLAAVLGLVASAFALVFSPMGIVIGLVALGVAALLKFTNVAEVLKEKFTHAWGGIADAIAAGDIKLAVEVLWLSIRAEFVAGINGLKRIWAELALFVQQLFDQIVGFVARSIVKMLRNIGRLRQVLPTHLAGLLPSQAALEGAGHALGQGQRGREDRTARNFNRFVGELDASTAAAEADRDEAIGQAADAKADAPDLFGTDPDKPFALPAIAAASAATGAAITPGALLRGTAAAFSAAQRNAKASDPATRAADAAEEQVEIAGDIRDGVTELNRNQADPMTEAPI